MRWSAVVLLLVLGGCGTTQKVGVDMAFDVDPDGGGTSAKCIASTGGSCQVDFRGAMPVRAVLQPGEMRRFDGIGPGVPVCIEPEAAELAKCEPIPLGAGYARIRKGRYDRLARLGRAG